MEKTPHPINLKFRMKKICFTVDMEPDCPPYLNTFRGIEEGTAPLLDLLDTEHIKATFFTTGLVARKYPQLIETIVAGGHELGCHGDSHQVFTEMDEMTARAEIQQSSQTLRRFAPVSAFRAPNLKFPGHYLELLESSGYRVDSSLAKYKLDYYRKPRVTSLKRIAVSMTSSVLRLPRGILFPILACLTEPVVLFVHPWEFVDLRREALRLDCRFRTGAAALACLRSVLRFFKRNGNCFCRIKDL
jgi:peptidoglycan/xylan/chitin deacetylase (PgdA/CDA1 family)